MGGKHDVADEPLGLGLLKKAVQRVALRLKHIQVQHAPQVVEVQVIHLQAGEAFFQAAAEGVPAGVVVQRAQIYLGGHIVAVSGQLGQRHACDNFTFIVTVQGSGVKVVNSLFMGIENHLGTFFQAVCTDILLVVPHGSHADGGNLH